VDPPVAVADTAKIITMYEWNEIYKASIRDKIVV
jgi:hypothetical protein